jgi:hypothetical protein
MPDAILCIPKQLSPHQWVSAARIASGINPVNHPPVERLMGVMRGFVPTPERIAVLTTKYWHSGGVKLTVGFLDNPPAKLRTRILAHMNAWAKTANVQFVETRNKPQVRIARKTGDGHWSIWEPIFLASLAINRQ